MSYGRAYEGRYAPRGPGGALQAALDRGDYEVAALRLLLGVAHSLEQANASAARAREELLALLGAEPEEGA